MAAEKKVKILGNGPYEVNGNISLDQLQFTHNEKGASLEYEKIKDHSCKDTYYLCRCGKSKNKPFCDGSHAAAEFDGTETAGYKTYDEMAKFIEGNLMDLKDAPELCAGARFCDTKSGTWNLVERAENKAAKDIVKHQCENCPSGRLTAITKDGRVLEPDLPQEISVLEDPVAGVHGPIYVKGGISVESAEGKTYPERNRVTLCRCGKSDNKPFCDGKHLGSD